MPPRRETDLFRLYAAGAIGIAELCRGTGLSIHEAIHALRTRRIRVRRSAR